jgi:chaperonin cofactor prefoldin
MSKKDETIDDVIHDAMTVTRKQGSALVQAALADLKQQYNERLVKFVSGTMTQIQTLTDQRDQLDSAIQLMKDRLQAINNGEFTISSRGEITFNEGKLNAGLYY